MRFAEFNAAFQPISGIKLCKTPWGEAVKAGGSLGVGAVGKTWGAGAVGKPEEPGSREGAARVHSVRAPGQR